MKISKSWYFNWYNTSELSFYLRFLFAQKITPSSNSIKIERKKIASETAAATTTRAKTTAIKRSKPMSAKQFYHFSNAKPNSVVLNQNNSSPN